MFGIFCYKYFAPLGLDYSITLHLKLGAIELCLANIIWFLAQ
jgi:hypothetical protein